MEDFPQIFGNLSPDLFDNEIESNNSPNLFDSESGSGDHNEDVIRLSSNVFSDTSQGSY